VANPDSLHVLDEIRYRDDAPYTKKLFQTERTIVMIVCLRPGQMIPKPAPATCAFTTAQPPLPRKTPAPKTRRFS